ncbi:hypothetical protein XACN24_13420 [Xanthomonas albilineans]|uniref:hypothetical protein n=1 Tax=Xanthomonas albilineans TaxID=29447 RepID=UPI003F884566
MKPTLLVAVSLCRCVAVSLLFGLAACDRGPSPPLSPPPAPPPGPAPAAPPLPPAPVAAGEGALPPPDMDQPDTDVPPAQAPVKR